MMRTSPRRRGFAGSAAPRESRQAGALALIDRYPKLPRRLTGGLRRVAPALFASLFAVAVFARPGLAQSDLYTIAKQPIDATASSASEAREIALTDGQRAAYGMLLRRITLPEDYVYHPEIDDSDIAGLVLSFEVDNEKTSSTRYLANLTIRFNRDSVHNLLRAFDVPFSETRSRAVLVVPIYKAGATARLWDEPNPWMAAWAEREGDESLVPLFPPLGDLHDMSSLTAEQALAGDAAALSGLAARYGAGDTLVATATVARDPTGQQNRLTVDLTRHGAAGATTDFVIFSAPQVDGLNSLMRQAAAQVARRLDQAWKRETLLRFGNETTLNAFVPLKDLGEWLKIRGRLTQMAEVSRIEIVSLTATDAQLVLHFLGDQRQLALALAQRDLELTDSGGAWVLRVVGQNGYQE